MGSNYGWSLVQCNARSWELLLVRVGGKPDTCRTKGSEIGAPGVRQIRPALHHGFAAGAVRQGVATIAKLSLPNKCLSDTADDAPETRSEKMFAEIESAFVGTDPATGRRRGLKTAMATVRQWRRRNGLRR